MVKTLQKHGEHQVLVIDAPEMEALGIDADTPLQVTISDNSLIVTPVQVGIGDTEVQGTLDQLRPRYSGMLKRLAE